MILKKLQIENIRSYENQEITFPRGSTLLSGDIGSGKTTILLAVEFALFGLQPSQKASSLLRNGADSGQVVLTFEIDGKEIVIERNLKKGKTITQDYSSITIDNQKFEGSVTEVKTKVLNLLNYPPEFAKKTNLLYKFTVYTPQEEMKQIILEAGDTRLNTLRYVFGIDKYKTIEENTALFTAKLREQIRYNSALISELDSIKETLNQKKILLESSKKKFDEESVNYDIAVQLRKEKEKTLNEVLEKQNEKKSFETEKAKTRVLISEKQQQTSTLNFNIKNLMAQIEEASHLNFAPQNLSSLNERITFQEEKESKLQNEYLEIISRLNNFESKTKDSNELKSKISHLQKCPTCLQEVSEGYKSNIFKKVEEEFKDIQKAILTLTEKKSELIREISSTKQIKESLKKEKSEQEILKLKLQNLNEKKQRLQDYEKQKQSLQNDLEMLDKHTQSLEVSIKEFEKYTVIYEERNKELTEAKHKENSLAIKKAEVNKEIQFLESQIKEIEENINKKELLKTKTEKLKELEYWISEKFVELILLTEKQVLVKLKTEFSELFTKWFGVLVSESLSAKLDDDFSPVIEQQDYELDYAFLSGGEKTAVALAYRLALNQVINSVLSKIKTKNLIILDEPTDGFSAQQLDKMRDVLSQIKTDQLIIVSHEQKIEGFVDKIIKFKKENGVTKVE